MKKAALISIILIMTGCVTVEMSDSERYQFEVDNIKKRLPEANFTNLRMNYTNTPDYTPFGGKEKLMIKPMFDALQKGDYKLCLKNAETILDSNYPSLNAHYAAMNCHYQLGNPGKSDYHRYVLDGLVDSISSSGDGISRETAYDIISPPEMRAFLDLKGLTVKKRNLVRSRSRAYNVMTVTDQQTNQKFEVNFDVTIQMSKGL